MKNGQFQELLLQGLETEIGGVEVYENALRCAVQKELKEEWEKYLEETTHHIEVLTNVCNQLSIDPNTMTPGREIVRMHGHALVELMQKALAVGDKDAAQLVACECVVSAETKDHQNWELLRECAKRLSGEEKTVLAAAIDEVEDQEDEHLYHSQGWCRELWIKSLGMKAVLPPPEEKKHVKTAIGASRAKHSREKHL